MPAQEPKNPIENRLLAALPAEEYDGIPPHLEPVTFSLGDSVYEPGKQLMNNERKAQDKREKKGEHENLTV